MPDTLQDAIAAGIADLGGLPEFDTETIETTAIPNPIINKKTAPQRSTPAPASETVLLDEEGNEIQTETSAEAADLSDDEVTQAKTIYKMLNNPSTAEASLRFLATSMGMELPEAPTTKAEVVEQTKDIIEEMKEAAPGLEFIVDKLGPIIKAHLETVRQEFKSTVEADRTERANAEIKNESANALIVVAKQFKYENNLIPKPILNEMTKMMEKLSPGEGLKPIEYINLLHDAARAKLKVAPVSTERTGKGPSPATRLASERVQPSRVAAAGPTKMSLNEAIANAVESLSGNK